MASLIHQSDPSVSPAAPWVRLEPVASWVRLEPVGFHHMLFDGCWWPSTTDPAVELCVLVPMLDRVRAPVAKLLLSAARWTARPHHIVAAGRIVSVEYLAGQSPTMMTVLCTDGGTLTLRVAGPDPALGVPDRPEAGSEHDARGNADAAIRPLRERVVR